MSVIGSNVLAGSSGQGGGYNLTKSLRFRRSASAYLNRTFGTPTNNKLFTWSGWVKRSEIGVWNDLFGAGGSNGFGFNTAWNDNGLAFFTNNISGDYFYLVTTQVFRDPSAWYHIVLAVDTTQATASNRAKIYVNGVQITAFNSAVYQSQNSSLTYNSATAHYLCSLDGTTRYFDGYLAEVNFIDGQALTPSSFGQTSTTTGVWIPKKYTGTYGTNGFYLPFTNTTSTSTLGNDFSGNSNTWTVNNISLTSGSTYDSMTDVPTLTSATTANYAVLNPLKSNSTTSTYQNGNLQVTFPSGAAGGIATGTISVSSGKFYWEVTVGGTDGNTQPKLGIISPTVQTEISSSIDVGDLGYAYVRNGNKSILGTVTAYGASFTTNDVIGFALDMDAGTLVCYKNNASQGTLVSGLSGQFTVGLTAYNGYSETINFGQRPFAYTPPTGFVALNTFNLPTPTIGATAATTANEYFDVSLWTGNGSSSQVVTNSGSMQPDFVWIKSRNQAFGHLLFDSVRGISLYLQSNSTGADTTDVNMLSSLNSNGFTVGSSGFTNGNGYTQVGWQWRASNATAVTNTAGSINSTVSANTTAGFSVVTYTGTGLNDTIGHGLGVAPSMIITKNRSSSSFNWGVYHASAGNTVYGQLNTTNAFSTLGIWQNTTPTSTVFYVANYNAANQGGDNYVAYCFAQVAGYSAFGSYTGNGSSDGPFVFLGFRPRFIMFKRTDSSGSWHIFDSSRNPYNLTDLNLYANGTNTDTTNNQIDLLSNGFKSRSSDTDDNASGGTVIYMAFAESPFRYANAR